MGWLHEQRLNEVRVWDGGIVWTGGRNVTSLTTFLSHYHANC